MIPVRLVVPVAVVALALLAWVLVRLCRLTLRGDDSGASRLARACMAAWFVGLLVVTLGGRPRDTSRQVWFNWVPFATQTSTHDTEILANLLLFTPAGLLLAWMVRVRGLHLLCGSAGGAALLSSVIELTQALTPLGTAGDITDVLLNTSGCVAGTAVGVVVQRFVRRRSGRSKSVLSRT